MSEIIIIAEGYPNVISNITHLFRFVYTFVYGASKVIQLVNKPACDLYVYFGYCVSIRIFFSAFILFFIRFHCPESRAALRGLTVVNYTTIAFIFVYCLINEWPFVLTSDRFMHSFPNWIMDAFYCALAKSWLNLYN